jgi:hypothetical protein
MADRHRDGTAKTYRTREISDELRIIGELLKNDHLIVSCAECRNRENSKIKIRRLDYNELIPLS